MKILLLTTIISYFSLSICTEANSTDAAGHSKTFVRKDNAIQLNIKLSGSLQNPAFSPDGKAIVFTRFRKGYNQGASDLFIYHLESKQLKQLISDNHSNVNLPGSAWNELNNTIVFSSDREPHDEIFLISSSGTTGQEYQLTRRKNKQSYEPSLSPNAQWIVFESHDIDVAGFGVISKFKIDGTSKYINLTAAENDCRQPNWAPMGDKILYQRKQNNRWAIWTMDTNGQDQKMITNLKENSTDAVFSHDGKWVVYSSENSHVERANLYKVPSQGGQAVRITNHSGYDGAPSISPDATQIVFESSPEDPDYSSSTTLWTIRI